MTKYRIIEKKGEYTSIYNLFREITSAPEELSKQENIYIPRYIVQEYHHPVSITEQGNYYEHTNLVIGVKDVKEFNNLEEAKKFKRELALEEGIVVE